MIRSVAKFFHFISKPLQLVMELVDFLFQLADDLVSLFPMHLLPGLLANLLSLACKLFAQFVHVGFV